jgi:RNA polymerase sigma-70 factor (ECF subfamily)
VEKAIWKVAAILKVDWQRSEARTVRAQSQSESREPSDADVVRLAQQGSAAAFERIYRRHSRRVYSLCLRMTGDQSQAEDLTQDVFLRLFRKIGTFRGESAFSTWLHRMAVNNVLMRFRRKVVAETSLETITNGDEEFRGLPQEFGAPDLRLNGVVDRVTVQAHIKELPPGYRAMFILHYIEGYKHSEIAEMFEFSEGNSKSRVRRARLRLRDLIQKALKDNTNHERQSTAGSPTLDSLKHTFDPANI